MDLAIKNPVALDVSVDLLLMVAVVAERIEDLSEGEMGKPLGDLFGRDAEAPILDNGPNRCPRALYDGLAAEDLSVGDDVAVFRGRGHRSLLRWRISLRVACRSR